MIGKYPLMPFRVCAAPTGAAAGKTKTPAVPEDDRVAVVVTGMRVNEAPENYTKDTTVAKDAVVRVTMPDGKELEKRTEPFTRAGRDVGEVFHTADFLLKLDTTYRIAMTFKDGTTLEIKDYKLPSEWKHHFSYHSTIGTLSPSSIMRKASDAKSNLGCYVYGVHPLANYRTLGGRQIAVEEE